MALSDAQMTDVRRYMGYPLAGTSMAITDDQDIVYGNFGLQVMSLHKRLSTLSANEESVLVNTYLSTLSVLETAVFSAADNLDTESAGPWTRNKNEIADRSALFNKWRRDMCAFIGFAPGPGLPSIGLRIARA